ncbi:uncharacterized protein LOC110733256 [Chenopodium quinoa]|uniref:uncharacterized protein LOC110733256 n=1 Tax=Chenopodium quinoa TaxID=63459 RepID=UPI000B7812CB|nr:uncharacterized protein LOC110733256 [Chenopodium quinoa]
MQRMKEEMEVTMPLKLLVNMEGDKAKVLYAEAGKDFVDFLFNVMSLPLGTLMKLIKSKENMAGCLGELYTSIESLNGEYLQENVDRDAVLKPRGSVSVPLLSIHDDALASEDEVENLSNVSVPSLSINNNDGPVNSEDVEKPCNKTGAGYVMGGVLTYMVMDNLEVKPMSTSSVVTLMKKFHVKDASSLIERNVRVGLNQGVAILKASLETRAVLTNVFLECIDLHPSTSRGSGSKGRSRWHLFK